MLSKFSTMLDSSIEVGGSETSHLLKNGKGVVLNYFR